VIFILIVYVDERERNSKVPEHLTAKGVTVIFKMLDVGDYIVNNVVGIERKTASDYINSLIDGRLFEQLSKLKERFDKTLLIVEGDIYKALKGRNIHRNAILGSHVSLFLDLGVFILYSRNEEETAELIKRIGLHKIKTSLGLHIPRKSGASDIIDWQKFVLQCFPHIGPKIAQRILEYFGSIYAFCNATIHELSRIEGLSEQKAAEIYQIVHSFYKDYEKNKLLRSNENQKSILDYVSVNENCKQ